jgi:hypothetical protein
MSMRINVNLFPKDGYVFKENDGSIHRSTKGWRDLIARVTIYRRVNNKPPGDPENEVHAQACAANPSYCSEGNPPPPTPINGQSLKGAVLRWLSELRRNKSKIELVKPEEAASRAGVCATCPFNVGLREGCAPCKTFVIEAQRDLLPGRKVDSRLNACDKLAVDLGVLVNLDEPPVKRDDLPNFCWKKRTI